LTANSTASIYGILFIPSGNNVGNILGLQAGLLRKGGDKRAEDINRNQVFSWHAVLCTVEVG
jgi:hypothetical protein